MSMGMAWQLPLDLGAWSPSSPPCACAPLRGGGVIFPAQKPRARGALMGLSTSEIAETVLKICQSDPCVRARVAAAATCAKMHQQRPQSRPPRACSLPSVAGGSGGAWRPVWGWVEVQKVARGGALLGLCWCWCRPSCRHSAASLAPAAPRTCPRAACSCCVVWCGSVAAGNGPATFVGAVLGLCMGICAGAAIGACGGVMGFSWEPGHGAWLGRWWSWWGVWWASVAASPCPWSRRSPLEGVVCGCRGGAQAAQTTTAPPRPLAAPARFLLHLPPHRG